jgi:hypothetical protein
MGWVYRREVLVLFCCCKPNEENEDDNTFASIISIISENLGFLQPGSRSTSSIAETGITGAKLPAWF